MHWTIKWLVVAFLGLAGIGASASQASAQDLLTTQAVWGVVKSTGGFSRHNGGISATKLGTGTYDVRFDRDASTCIYSGTLGNPGTGTPPSGQITLVQRAGAANGLFIQTFNSAGALSDRAFYVEVDCN